MDEEVQMILQVAEKYGFEYDEPDFPRVTGFHRNRNIELFEYGMGDAFAGPAPYAVFVRFDNPARLELSVDYHGSRFHGEQAHVQYIERLILNQPGLYDRLCRTGRFYLRIHVTHKDPGGEVALMPFYPYTTNSWCALIEFGIDLAEALEQHMRKK